MELPLTPGQQAMQNLKKIQDALLHKPKVHQVKPKESTEDLATDYILAALALLEEADKHSQFSTKDIQAMIERGLEIKATHMKANKPSC